MSENAPRPASNQLKLYFPMRAGSLPNRTTGCIKAVDGISFDIRRGETLGLVGESGCGKTTAGRAILQLYRPDRRARSVFRGADLAQQSPRGAAPRRRHMQMIFQDPYASLNPQMRVGEIIARPLARPRHGGERSARGDAARRRS